MEYYKDSHITVYNKDCRNMSELANDSVQCVITSPPYWGLRKYAGEQDLIWGNKDCEHKWGNEIKRFLDKRSPSQLASKSGLNANKNPDASHVFVPLSSEANQGSFCSLCSAWKGAYGLEPKPELYVQHTIEVLREIRRVLRKDGVVFWNIGDSYVSGKSRYSSKSQTISCKDRGDVFTGKPDQYYHSILKDKDLALIPFRVALAAQEDGWWVRSVIIWNKPNPMPESVKDRPTESHEYILMLTKSARYYWDQEAVREKQTEWESVLVTGKKFGGNGTNLPKGAVSGFGQRVIEPNPAGRNLRSVWTFPTQGYPEAHFAVFPEALPERCIKAGSKEGDTILDPFAGSGTTLWVAKKLNRKAVGYELSKEYCRLIIERNHQQGLI